MTSQPASGRNPRPSGPTPRRVNAILATSATLLTVVVLAALIGVVIAKRGLASDRRGGPADVTLIAANSAIADAFTPPAVIATPPVAEAAAQQIATTTQQLPTSGDRGVRLVSGTHAGLYGGVNQQNSCDVAAIANTVGAQPGKARAWSQPLSIQSGQIPYYLNSLTPVVLTTDTWVSAHRYSGDSAAPFQAVLQAGSAVLVDAAGVPRVQCASGAPLTPPANLNLSALGQTGTAWPGYSPQNVVAIAYTDAPSSFTDPVPTSPVTQFILVNLSTGEPLNRKAGGTINIDQSTNPMPLPNPVAANKMPK